jgi:hypothetical protein
MDMIGELFFIMAVAIALVGAMAFFEWFIDKFGPNGNG